MSGCRYASCMDNFSHPALYPDDRDGEPPVADSYMRLAPIEKAFVDAYIANLGSSAKAAGTDIYTAFRKGVVPAGITARANAMLQLPHVQAAIGERARALCAKFDIDKDRIIREVAQIAFSNIAHYMHVDKDTGLPYYDFRHVTLEQMAAIQSLTVEEIEPSKEEQLLARMTGKPPKPRTKVKLTMHPKNDAIDKLMKMLDMYASEKHEVNINVQSQSITAEMSPEQLAEIWSNRLKGER